MPLKIIHPNHFEIIGTGLVLLSSPPTATMTTDLSVGSMTEEIALLSKGHAIIGREAKSTNQARTESTSSDYFANARRLLVDLGARFILELRGTKEPGVEIKVNPSLVPEEVVELVRMAFAVNFEVKLTSQSSAEHHRYSTNGEAPAIVLEFGPNERTTQRDSVIASVTDTIGLINGKLGNSEGDKGSGDALD